MKEIPLSQGKVAFVDDADYGEVSRYKWSAWRQGRNHTFYAVRSKQLGPGRWCVVYMHRELMPHAKRIDHRNGDGLDNRRMNLRDCTQQQNCRNRTRLQANKTSLFKGVDWVVRKNKWRARIHDTTNHEKSLGYYADQRDAAQAYNWAAALYYGEFASFNTEAK